MRLALAALLVMGTARGAATQHPQSYSTRSGERATVFHAAADSGKAVRVLELVERFPPLPGLPASIPRDVAIYLAPDEAALRSLTGGAIPEWGAGVALPRENAIVIPAYASARGRGWSDPRLLRHEWAHAGMHQHLGGLRVPRWFSEGYAEWASGGWDWGEGWRLRVGLVTGGPSLDSLTLSWPGNRAEAHLAYLLSATALEYLVRSSGQRGLTLFLERWKETESFEGAFRTTFGVTLGQFEQDWRRYVKDRYGWLFVLSHSAVFWLALTLALLLMARVRRSRDREALARLRATEPPEDPAYWAVEKDRDAEDDPTGPLGGM